MLYSAHYKLFTEVYAQIYEALYTAQTMVDIHVKHDYTKRSSETVILGIENFAFSNAKYTQSNLLNITDTKVQLSSSNLCTWSTMYM